MLFGNYFTSLEMVGVTLSVMALTPELMELLEVDCACCAGIGEGKMDGIHMRYGAEIVREIAAAIEANAAYLSDIDGKIGDGDHGVNMNKGFTRAAALLDGTENFEHALQTVSDILMNEIGGSMGPLYGLMFAAMADSLPNAQLYECRPFFAHATCRVRSSHGSWRGPDC